MSYTLDLIKKTIKFHGVPEALHAITLLAINKVVPVKILKCALLTKIDSKVLDNDQKYKVEFLNHEEIEKRFGNGFNDLPSSFADLALKKGDHCLCVVDNHNAVAAYSWFSNKETYTDLDNLKFIFDPAYVYTFKVFTQEEHRGKRLHAHQMNKALTFFQQSGHSGIVCYINSDNFDSLKSHYRMGFKDIGSIIVFKMLGKYFHFDLGACKQHGVRLKEA